MTKPTILCVDDEIDNLDALERLFRKKYHVLKAESGEKALEVLRHHTDKISLILTDQRMPKMSGVELLEEVIKVQPEIIRILITGFTELESVIQAVNKGQIYRYITKPWDPTDLGNTVDRAVERFHLNHELKEKTTALEQAYKELKTLDEAKSKFMILINHELKTPLTSIINFLSLLHETKLDEDQKLYTDRMEKSANKLKQIIEDVLIIMKSETNQLQIDPQSLLLTNVEIYLNEDNKKILQTKKLQLKEQFEALEFKADKRLFLQILNRIINNAFKFATESSVVEINGTKVDSFYEFKITNKGPLISDEALKKIFQPFYLEENIMNHSLGLGLGLSICDKLLNLHGTHLNIRNTDEGVQVSFYFPLISP